MSPLARKSEARRPRCLGEFNRVLAGWKNPGLQQRRPDRPHLGRGQPDLPRRAARPPVWRVARGLAARRQNAGQRLQGRYRLYVGHQRILHPRQPRFTIPENVANWCFATDSQSVVTFSYQGHLMRWTGNSFQRGEPVMDLSTNYDVVFYVNSVFSKDGRFLANGSANGIIRVWDLAQGTLLRQITNTADIVIPVKFLADGSRLLTGSFTGWAFHEWDVATGRELQSWPALGTAGDEQIADSRGRKLFCGICQ